MAQINKNLYNVYVQIYRNIQLLLFLNEKFQSGLKVPPRGHKVLDVLLIVKEPKFMELLKLFSVQDFWRLTSSCLGWRSWSGGSLGRGCLILENRIKGRLEEILTDNRLLLLNWRSSLTGLKITSLSEVILHLSKKIGVTLTLASFGQSCVKNDFDILFQSRVL